MLLDFFSTLLSGYLIIAGIWLITLIIVFVKLLNRRDIYLPIKIFWAAIIFIAPVLGLILYIIYGLPKRRTLTESNKNIDHRSQ